MIWWILCLCGLLFLILSLVGSVNAQVRAKREPQEIDSIELRTELVKWEVLVLERYGTVRDVKQFANRVRFVVFMWLKRKQEEDKRLGGDGDGTVKWGKNELSKVVALVGMVELRILPMEPKFAGRAGLAMLKAAIEMNAKRIECEHLPKGSRPDVETIVKSLGERDWLKFAGIARNVRFPRRGEA